jgi:hypothetical protein
MRWHGLVNRTGCNHIICQPGTFVGCME